jgi:hypothetical protein
MFIMEIFCLLDGLRGFAQGDIIVALAVSLKKKLECVFFFHFRWKCTSFVTFLLNPASVYSRHYLKQI